MSSRILEKIKNTIIEHEMIQSGDSIITGLSGGPDSVCLFHSLCMLKDELQIREITAVHINHGLRGDESDGDEAYAASLAAEAGADFRVFRYDVAAEAALQGTGTEEAGRKLRYAAFEQVRLEKGAQRIAVAHNMNDQAETVLMRIMRGTGLRGLGGIDFKREDGIVIRPVLSLSRDEIEQYCEENNLKPHIDSTNNEEIYTRNKIRLSLLPQIKKDFNPNIIESLVRLSVQAREDDDFITAAALEFMDKPFAAEKAELYTEIYSEKKSENCGISDVCYPAETPAAEIRGINNADTGYRPAATGPDTCTKAALEVCGIRWNESEKSLKIYGFKELHKAAAKRVIMTCAARAGMEQNMSAVNLESVMDIACSGIEARETDLSDGFYVRLSYGKLWFLRRKKKVRKSKIDDMKNKERAAAASAGTPAPATETAAGVSVPFRALLESGTAVLTAAGRTIRMAVTPAGDAARAASVSRAATPAGPVGQSNTTAALAPAGPVGQSKTTAALTPAAPVGSGKTEAAGTAGPDQPAATNLTPAGSHAAPGASAEQDTGARLSRAASGAAAPQIKLQLDFDRLLQKQNAVFRTRQPGDRISPRGMKGSKKLQDYFTDRKIPRHLRDEMLLLVSEGRVIAAGSEVTGECPVSIETDRILTIEY